MKTLDDYQRAPHPRKVTAARWSANSSIHAAAAMTGGKTIRMALTANRNVSLEVLNLLAEDRTIEDEDLLREIRAARRRKLKLMRPAAIKDLVEALNDVPLPPAAQQALQRVIATHELD